MTLNSLYDFTQFELLCLPCVLLVLCLFVFLVDFQFRFEGKTLVINTPVPDQCYFFIHSDPFCNFALFTYLISSVFVVYA